MRLFWKIVLGIVVALLLLAAGGFVWMLVKPNAAAKIADPGALGRRIAQDGIFGNYFPAEGMTGPRPAVLVIGGSEGGLSDEVRDEAVLLQKHGFNVLQLAYFNAPGKGSKLERVPVERFTAGLDWLKRQPSTDPARIAIMGYSKGGEAALLVATRYPGIRAAVIGMPSSVVWDALSMRSYIFGGISSWTEKGVDVPSLAYAKPDRQDDMVSRFGNALKGLPQSSPLRLPVETFSGRILLVCGASDTLWPSCPMAQDIVKRAVARGAAAPELLVYPDAGHGVMGPPMPAGDPRWRRWQRLGGTVEANAAARTDSWAKIIAFLDRALAKAD